MSKRRNKKKKNKNKNIKKGLKSMYDGYHAPAYQKRTEEINATNFSLIIPDQVWQKIFWWINKSNHEVSGFGSLDHDIETNTFTVRDAILLKQEVAATSTEIDPNALAKAIYETRNEHNALKWHWHSHVDMGVFWSADDKELIRSLAQQGWILATVFNKKRETRTAFSCMTDVIGMQHEMFVDNIPTVSQRLISPELTAQWDAEYAAKVQPERNRWESKKYEPKQFPLIEKETQDERELSEIKDHLPHRTSEAKFEPKDFDKTGYAWSLLLKTWAYNPYYDESLLSDRERMLAIDEMSIEEVELMRNHCPKFADIYRRYIIEAAGGTNGNGSKRSSTPNTPA